MSSTKELMLPWWITPQKDEASSSTTPVTPLQQQQHQGPAFKDPTICKMAVALLLYVLDDERQVYFTPPSTNSKKKDKNQTPASPATLVNSNGEDSTQERKADFDFLLKTILDTQQQTMHNNKTSNNSEQQQTSPSSSSFTTTTISSTNAIEFTNQLEANATAQVIRLRATIDERIALIILFVQACLRKGRYSARSRANVRRLAQVLGIPFLPVQDFEKQTAIAVDEEVARRETALAVDRNRTKDNLIKFAKISGFVVVGGGLMFVTGGLAAPALAGALGAVAGTVATSIGAAATVLGVGGTAVATITGGAALITTAAMPLLTATSITAAFGVGGAALAGSRAHNRMRNGGTITLRFIEDQENVSVLALSNFGFDDDDEEFVQQQAKIIEKNNEEDTKTKNNRNDDDDEVEMSDFENTLGGTMTLRVEKAKEEEILKNEKKKKEEEAKQQQKQQAAAIATPNPTTSNSNNNNNNKGTITSTSMPSEIATKIVAEVADENIAVRPGPIVPLNYRPEATRHALESVQKANRSLVISIENLVQVENVTLELIQCVVETGCPILSAPRKIPPQCCALFSIRNRPFFPTGSACYVVLKVNKKENSNNNNNKNNNESSSSSTVTETANTILSERTKAPKVGDALLWLFLAIDLIGGVKANAAWMPITATSPKFPMTAEALVENGEFLDAKAKSLNSNGIESKTLNAASQPYIIEMRNEDDKLARVMFKSKVEKTSLQQTAAGLPFLHLKTQFTDVVSDLVRYAALDIPTYWTGSHPLSLICTVSNELSTAAAASTHTPIQTRHLRVYDGKPMDKVAAVRELPSNKESFGAIAVISEKSSALPFSANLVQFVMVFAVPVPTRGRNNNSNISTTTAASNNNNKSSSFSTNSGIIFVSIEVKINDTRTSNKVQSIRFKIDTHISDPLRKDFITTSTEDEKMKEIPLLLASSANGDTNNPAQLLLESPSSASPPIIALQHESFCVVLEALNPAWFLSSTIGSDANIASQLLKTHENAVGSCALLKIRFVDPDFGRTARRKLSQVIGISGFLPLLDSARGNADQLLPMLGPALRSSALTRASEVYLAEWEIEQQKFFFDALRRLSKSLTAKDVVRAVIKKQAKSQVKGHVMAFLASNALFAGIQGISAVSGAFALPAYIAWGLEAIDNSYAVLANRAKDAGEALAETLKNVKEKKKAKQKEQKEQPKPDQNNTNNNKPQEDKFKNEQDVRPVTLVGVSFGGAVALYCAMALAEAGELSILENVIVAGVPYFFSKSEWRKARKAVVGRLINIHSNDDPILRLLYRGNTLKIVGGGQPAGLGKVRNVSGLENVDARAVIRTHLDYGDRMESVMKLIPQREEWVYFERKKSRKKREQEENNENENDSRSSTSSSSSSSSDDDSDKDDANCGDEVENESGLPASAVVKIKDSPTMIMNVLAATIEKVNIEDEKLIERRKQRKKEEEEQRKIREKMVAASASEENIDNNNNSNAANPTIIINDDDDEVRTLTFIVANNCSSSSDSTVIFSRAASDIHPSLTPIFRPPSSSSSHELSPGEVTSWSYRFNQGLHVSSVFTMFSAMRFEVFKKENNNNANSDDESGKISKNNNISMRAPPTHQVLLFLENGVDDVQRYSDVSNKATCKILTAKRAFARPSVAVIDLVRKEIEQKVAEKSSSSSSPLLFAATKLFLFSTSASAESAEAKKRKHIVLVISISDLSEEHAKTAILNKKILPPASDVFLKEFDNENDDEDVVVGELDPDRDKQGNSSILTSFLNAFTTAIISSPKHGKNDNDDSSSCVTQMRLSSLLTHPQENDDDVENNNDNDNDLAPFGNSPEREEKFQTLIKNASLPTCHLFPSSSASPIFLVCACNFINRSKTNKLRLLKSQLVLPPMNKNNQDQSSSSSVIVSEFLLGQPPSELSIASTWNTENSTLLYISINLCSLYQFAQTKEQLAIATLFFQPVEENDKIEDERKKSVIRADLCLVIDHHQKKNSAPPQSPSKTTPTTPSASVVAAVKKANVTSVFTRIFRGSVENMMMKNNNNNTLTDQKKEEEHDDDDVEGNDHENNAPSPTSLDSTIVVQNQSESGRVGLPVAVDVLSKIGGHENVVVAELQFDLK